MRCRSLRRRDRARFAPAAPARSRLLRLGSLGLGSLGLLGAALVGVLIGQSSPPAPAVAADEGDSAAVSTVDETPAETRRRLERMSAEEREELRRRSKRFYELAPGEQDRYRELHQQLSAHPDEPRLREVLQRYTQWLRTLSSRERNELLSLPADERIARIKDLKQEQETRRFRGFAGFPGDDQGRVSVNPGIIHAWLDKIVERNEEQLLALLHSDRRESYASDKDDGRRLRLMYALWPSPWRRGPPDFEQPPPQLITPADIDTLAESLPSEAKALLAAAETPERRLELVERWSRAMLFARRTPVIPQEALEAFFEELPVEVQAQLEELSRDQYLRELEMRYIGFRSFGGRDGGRRGGRSGFESGRGGFESGRGGFESGRGGRPGDPEAQGGSRGNRPPFSEGSDDGRPPPRFPPPDPAPPASSPPESSPPGQRPAPPPD